jgi:hypothetical protein
MIRFIIIISLLLSTATTIANDDKLKISPTKDEKMKSGVYIPKDIYDAHKELDNMLTIELKQEIKNGNKDDLIQYHFGLGSWMRNNWGLWAGSNLSKWFNSNGINHPDDMSGIIIDTYYHHLRNEPLGLEKKLEYSINYWTIRKKPSKPPCENGKVIFALIHLDKGREHYYHIGKCGDANRYMFYEHGKGWNNTTKRMLKRIEELKDQKGLISAPLIKPN